jgi:hypothetical protein
MFAAEINSVYGSNPSAGAQSAGGERALLTAKVYTRHKRNCPKRDRSDWARSVGAGFI